MTGHQPREALSEVLTQPLSSAGLDLEGVEISKAGRRTLVRVMVDKDGGITLDDIAQATRLVSGQLDEHDVMDEAPYTLEVTSPGIDRPLTLPRHWRRNLDRLVKVTPHEGAVFTGRITGATDDAATVDVGGAVHNVPFVAVSTARIEIEFNPPRPAKHADPTEQE
jgi:ribosome maturation factor RimP